MLKIKIPVTKKGPVYIVRVNKYDLEGNEIADTTEFWVCQGTSSIKVLKVLATLSDGIAWIEDNGYEQVPTP